MVALNQTLFSLDWNYAFWKMSQWHPSMFLKIGQIDILKSTVAHKEKAVLLPLMEVNDTKEKLFGRKYNY